MVRPAWFHWIVAASLPAMIHQYRPKAGSYGNKALIL
jgi:hypothetical protein